MIEITALDRLSNMIEEKDQELAKLREEIENERDLPKWQWMRHTELPQEQSLPVPRLEMWLDEKNSDDFNRVWVYRMIYRHFLKHCVAVPLGCTKQGGSMRDHTLREMMPFRDGAHIGHDAEQFGWPYYIIHGDECEKLP